MTRRNRGQALIAGGCFVGLGVVLHFGEGYGLLVYVVALSIFSVLPIGVGTMLLRARGQRALLASAPGEAWEPDLLRLARMRDGNLTVAEAVAYCDLSRTEAEEQLDALCRAGLAEVRVAQDGVLVYRVLGFLTPEQKRRAEGVLDA